ncbi:MAG: mannosyltransferase [Caeruleum heppii]|nr:MAG: mannosyltransferase [Caeruleum heppii]
MSPRHEQRPPHIKPIVAFYCFFVPGLLAALYAPILDCDETFNYWEPTHYLRHGFGLQTWEYSPDFAIRSWLYIALHAIVGRLVSLLPGTTKLSEFYLLRIFLAGLCGLCETRLYLTIARTINPRVAILFLLCMMFSPGMFHASPAFLPSSFAMCMAMLGLAAFMDWRKGLQTAPGIMWFGIAGIVGWPFAMILSVPFLLEEMMLAIISRAGLITATSRALDGVTRSTIVLALGVATDLFFYHSLEVVPFNIVWYNVFGGPSKGPNIFGTEPWHFYIRNLLLNFNIWFILAVLAFPLMTLQVLFKSEAPSVQTRLRGFFFISPFYLWLAIFSSQPHKEERFMYPVYPFLGLNAAIALHILLAAFGSTNPNSWTSKVSARLKLAVVFSLMLPALYAGLFRMLGVVTAYSAPLKVLKPLQQPDMVGSRDILCYGKEWYRYPSSYFVPKGMRTKFVKSEFDGLLPGEFGEATVGFGFWQTWLIPPGMNDQNEEDIGKYVSATKPVGFRCLIRRQIDISHCDYLVDSHFPNDHISELQPDHVSDDLTWEPLSCERFLDASRTSMVGRMLWLPDSKLVPERHRRQWGQYCLLRRKREVV